LRKLPKVALLIESSRKTTFQAPNQVALYLFTQGGWVVENFNDSPVEVVLNGRRFSVEARGWHCSLGK
jgi:hypothetical protein